MKNGPFTVKTEMFEGPLDLLLALIEKRKLHINDISLAKVADDFIAYVEKLKEFPVSQTANFIVVASTLLLIKSKSLLPSIELSEEETSSIEDLERRLRLYKIFKRLSHNVREHFGVRTLYPRCQSEQYESVFSPPEAYSLTTVKGNIQNVLKNLPRKEQLKRAMVEKVISLEEMVEHLTKRISKNLQMSFSDFSKKDSAKRVEVIVGFLAMLELVKQGIIKVAQEGNFRDIIMESERVDVPKY